MRKGTLRRHRAIGVAALLASGGFIIAACSPAAEDAAAPVYLMGTVAPDTFGKVSPVMRQSLASAPIERTEIAATATPTGEPIALAPSLTASAAAAQPASDVIPLDDPPALAKPRFQTGDAGRQSRADVGEIHASAKPFRIHAGTGTGGDGGAKAGDAADRCCIGTACPDSGPAACRDGGGTASYRAERRRIGARRARPGSCSCSAPAPQPITAMTQPAAAIAPPVISAEPARGDIATTGVAVSARDDRAGRYRPRYYYAP